ncbi:hypothetical protein ACHAWO_011917 [Cyclotella atomus]|uniref:Chitin-binding type-2 domain-containing protein n=1 Tax=Cyclotella atomus TaxID=382360 RepID=A0ABD3PAG6_9STRA
MKPFFNLTTCLLFLSAAICDKTEYCIENNLHGFIIWELSGDVMRDLSTPLLDAVHRKLKDPSLSCSEEFGLGSPTFTGYGVGPTTINSTVNTPAQAPSSTTSSPTIPLSCPDGFTGSMPYDICYSFYTCVYGNPTYPITTCPSKS